MKILVVNAFVNTSKSSTHGRGKSGFPVFLSAVRNALKVIATVEGADQTSPPIVEIVKADELERANFVADWQSLSLNERSKLSANRFDAVDMIFVGGDSTTSPYDACLTQLMTLAHMANVTGKPMFSCGVGALVDIVSYCCKGTKWNILNQELAEHGSLLDTLPLFAHYSTSNGTFPSGWLDYETGDVYCYDSEGIQWVPCCNTGIHHIEPSGKPKSPRFLSPGTSSVCDDHVRSTPREVQSLFVDRDAKSYVDTRLQQHFAFDGGLRDNSAFVLTGLGRWVLNRAWSMPLNSHKRIFTVLAATADAPIVVEYNHKLVVACEINTGKGLPSLRKLAENFVRHYTRVLLDQGQVGMKGTIDEITSYSSLFGELQRKNDFCPPLNKKKIISMANPSPVCPAGPVKVDAPLLEMFFSGKANRLDDPDSGDFTPKRMFKVNQNGKVNTGKGFDNISPNKNSTGFAFSEIGIQNPTAHRESRLIALIEKNGLDVANSVSLIKGSHASAQLNFGADVGGISEASMDECSGLILSQTGSISTRRRVNYSEKLASSVMASPIRPTRPEVERNSKGHARSVTFSENNGNVIKPAAHTSSGVDLSLNLDNLLLDMTLIRNANQSEMLSNREDNVDMEAAFLPHRSPRSATSAGTGTGTWATSKQSPRVIANSKGGNRNGKPYTTFRKIQKQKEQTNRREASQEYEGQ